MTPLALAPLLAALAADATLPPVVPVASGEARGKEDTSYGRVEGDMSVVVGLGVAVAARGPRAAGDLRLRYLDTVGAWGTYEDAPIFGSAGEPARVVAFGLEVRPLFLGRWLEGAELGVSRVDLAIDSLGLELGPYFAQPAGTAFASRAGLQLGVGLELPVFAHASGPWLGVHGGVRWSDTALGGDPVRGPVERAAFVALTVAWHQVFLAHVVSQGERAP